MKTVPAVLLADLENLVHGGRSRWFKAYSDHIQKGLDTLFNSVELPNSVPVSSPGLVSPPAHLSQSWASAGASKKPGLETTISLVDPYLDTRSGRGCADQVLYDCYWAITSELSGQAVLAILTSDGREAEKGKEGFHEMVRDACGRPNLFAVMVVPFTRAGLSSQYLRRGDPASLAGRVSRAGKAFRADEPIHIIELAAVVAKSWISDPEVPLLAKLETEAFACEEAIKNLASGASRRDKELLRKYEVCAGNAALTKKVLVPAGAYKDLRFIIAGILCSKSISEADFLAQDWNGPYLNPADRSWIATMLD